MALTETPLVAILVPTFNRRARLTRLLASFAEEIGDRRDVVVLVSDNASPDGSGGLLDEAAARHPWLRVHHQPENVGGMANLRWVVRHAPAAEYAWAFGDDDLLVPGALATVLDLLRAERPAWLWLPHRWVDEHGAHVRDSPAPGVVDRHASSGGLFRAYHHWLGLISASVVRREALQRAVAEADRPNSFAPVLWFCRAGAEGPCVAAPEHLLLECMDISWGHLRHPVLTLDWTGLWQDGLHAHLDADAFGRTVDVFYAGDWTLELWRQADLDDLAARVRQLPSSELLRAHLWTIARERGDRSVLGALADGDREARARAHVAAGEAAFTAGRARDAAGEFLAAVRLAPTLAAGWNDLAVALHALGRPAAAAEAVACALFAAPADEDALANRDALLAAA